MGREIATADAYLNGATRGQAEQDMGSRTAGVAALLSSLATSGVFHQADSARVWAVWFDGDGRVTSFIEPEWKSSR